MSKVCGKYKMESSENFDEFMKALGVGMVMRKMANTASPAVEITEAEGKYTMKTITTFKTTEIVFKLGETFTETTADGRVVQSTITLDGDKMVHKQIGDKEKKEKDSVINREFSDAGFTLICTVDDITSKRVYKRE